MDTLMGLRALWLQGCLANGEQRWEIGWWARVRSVLLPSVFSLQVATGWLCWFIYLFVFGHTRQQAGS